VLVNQREMKISQQFKNSKERLRHRFQDSTDKHIIEECGVIWIEISENRDQWKACVNTIMNFSFKLMCRLVMFRTAGWLWCITLQNFSRGTELNEKTSKDRKVGAPVKILMGFLPNVSYSLGWIFSISFTRQHRGKFLKWWDSSSQRQTGREMGWRNL
jgi:cytochrome bd-type quinol oxidase subunit 1